MPSQVDGLCVFKLLVVFPLHTPQKNPVFNRMIFVAIFSICEGSKILNTAFKYYRYMCNAVSSIRRCPCSAVKAGGGGDRNLARDCIASLCDS